MGDYVDRGAFSLEVVIFLYSLKVIFIIIIIIIFFLNLIKLNKIKINFPNNVILLRGNHESRQMTSYFNFELECKKKKNQKKKKTKKHSNYFYS